MLRHSRGTGHMKRREFISLLGGAAATWPLAARAQQPERMRRIGVLVAYAENDREGQAFVAAFREGLQKLGWTEGRNVHIETRWAAVDVGAMQRFAKELVVQQPDLILTQNTPTTAAMLQQTRSIPIVFANVSDPVGSGFVVSFPLPGGNVTGFVVTEPTMAGKWLELLDCTACCESRDAVQPGIGRRGVPWLGRDPVDGGHDGGVSDQLRGPSYLQWCKPAFEPFAVLYNGLFVAR